MNEPVEWIVSDGITPYPDAVAAMHKRVAHVESGSAAECVWLVEHPPLYTAGVSAKDGDLVDAARFPVYRSERGGQYTYHGPGQRVVYPILDLRKRNRDVRAFIRDVEDWVIATLLGFNVRGERRQGRVGVWVDRTQPGGSFREDKIAAIGVRVRKWISFHGLALNVEPDLGHFSGIVPCGISDPGLGITSLVDLGLPVTMHDVDAELRRAFQAVFNRSVVEVPPQELAGRTMAERRDAESVQKLTVGGGMATRQP